MTPESLIMRLKRRMTAHMLGEIEGLSGEEALQVYARIMARAGTVRVEKMRARALRDATGPRRATTSITVTFAEATGADGYTLSPQVLFRTRYGVTFRTLTNLARSAAAAPGDVVIAVEAEWSGFDGNVGAREILEWAIADLSNRNTVQWVSGTNDSKDEFLRGVRDGTITFVVDDDPTGGRPGTLDLKARGYGMPRMSGEDDATLKKRLTTAPDAVTPGGLLRAVNAVLGGDYATASEWWEVGFAWGVSGWGLHGWSSKRSGFIFVPRGSNIVALQALVNQLKGMSYKVIILERST